MVFGEIVRVHRHRLGLTQEELAQQVGLSVRSIGYIESGRAGVPRVATVRRLADAFGLVGADREGFLQLATGATNHPPISLAVPAQLPPDVSAFTGRDHEHYQRALDIYTALGMVDAGEVRSHLAALAAALRLG